jgi:hypothetical protein
MIVGDRGSFAIESAITEAVTSLSQRALGYFLIHVAGRPYGVKRPDATMLGCSLEEVKRRFANRGSHQMPQASHATAASIVEAYLDLTYRDTVRESYLGLTRREFGALIMTSGVEWAPDGDAAFDDGSFVLQFDVGDNVRLIAFRNADRSEDIEMSISEESIGIDIFYGILSDWSRLFEAEWSKLRRNADPGLN